MASIPRTSDSITHSSRSIPVAFEASNEEHRTREMMVRGSYEDFNHEQTSRVCFSSGEDTGFLNIPTLMEDDYSQLRRGIFLGSGNWTLKLNSLFQQYRKEDSRFIDEFLKLSIRDQSEVIQILKTTDFTHSSQLKHSFHLDNDQSITSLPHSHLEEVSSESGGFQNQLHQSQFQLTKMQESCFSKQQLIQKLEAEIEQLCLKLNSPVIRNTIQKTTRSSKENNPRQLQSNKDLSKPTLPDQFTALIQQNKELEETNRKLIEEKCSLEAKCCELMKELSKFGSASQASTRDVTELRETNRRLEAEKQQLHIEVIQAIAENKSLSHQINGVEDVIELQKGRIRDLEASRDSFALRCEELRSELILQEQSTASMNSKLEEQCSIVKKLVSNLHLCKDQICDRKVTISQQEERIISLCKKLKEITNSKSQIELRCQELQKENKSNISEIQDLKTNLTKTSKQLNENDRMISLLVEQMNQSKKSSASRSQVFSNSFCKGSFLNRKNRPPISASSRSVLKQHVEN